MKKAAFVLILFTSLCFADQVATTEDGKKVMLVDDGTWYFIPTQQSAKESVYHDRAKTEDEYANAEGTLKTKCSNDWPDDFNMRSACVELQRDAIQKLKAGRPNDINLEQYNTVHAKCKKDWPDDFNMRAACEQLQYEAIRKLRQE